MHQSSRGMTFSTPRRAPRAPPCGILPLHGAAHKIKRTLILSVLSLRITGLEPVNKSAITIVNISKILFHDKIHDKICCTCIVMYLFLLKSWNIGMRRWDIAKPASKKWKHSLKYGMAEWVPNLLASMQVFSMPFLFPDQLYRPVQASAVSVPPALQRLYFFQKYHQFLPDL